MHAHSQINTDIKMNTISSVSNRILSSKKINNIPDDKKQNIAIQEKNSNQCHVSGDNWQAVSGVNVENSMAKANKLINKFALTVLRLSIYEMMFQKETDSVIIIDEAIEISKDFGAEDSYKFINAVLDNVRKDLEKTNE